MTALVSWWRGPQNAVGVPVRLAAFTFDIQGIVPVAYSVFAVALGIAAGAIFKRVLPAMAVTFTAFAGLRFLIAEYARPRYLTAVSSHSRRSAATRPRRQAPGSCRTRPSGRTAATTPPESATRTPRPPAAPSGSKAPG